MGVEFDFRINVTDCLAGFSLLNGLSLFAGCVVPFLLLFFILLSAPPLPSHASFVCSWILADRGQSCLSLWLWMGQTNAGYTPVSFCFPSPPLLH